MFYDYDRSSRPRQIKTRKEIEEILEKKPYLRYLFNGVINDDGPDCDYHDLIVAEGKRLALNPPLSIERFMIKRKDTCYKINIK